MAELLAMPKMGLTMTEGTIEEWKKKEGDTIAKGEVYCSVSTDKLTNDVKSDFEGTLLKIVAQEGDTVPVLEPIGVIGAPGENYDALLSGGAAPAAAAAPAEEAAPAAAAAAAPAPSNEHVVASPAAKKLAKSKNIDLALVTGTGPKGRITLEDVEKFDPKTVAGKKTSPMAAKLAAEKGIDVNTLDVNGRVMKADVLAAAGKGAEAAAAAAPAAEPESNDEPAKKVNSLRRSIAANMANSWHTSPRVTYTRPIDCTAMKEMRAKLKDGFKAKGLKLTYNHILMMVISRVLLEFPDINSSFKDNMLTHHKYVNMGLAVAKGDGLIVPNVKKCDTKTLAEISKETEDLIAKTREGTIDMGSITGGTFTISSLGQFGITCFSPIINQPELAILGVCDMVDTPVVRDGQIVIRCMMNLSLTADHRVVDGVMASKFLKRVAEVLENPYELLA
jgi:pyruvate dehydrogenase E2 component (dihydrolipoamide acetyltransferase)